MKKFGNAQEALQSATSHMYGRKKYDKAPIMRMINKVFHMRDDDSTALTVLAVAARVEPHIAGELFLYLYGEREDHRLLELSGYLYEAVAWPFRPDYRVGVNICRSILLHHYWYKNRIDYYSPRELEREPQLRTLSPTVMSKMLNMPLKKDRRTGHKRPFDFLKWQKAEPQRLLELLEDQASRYINGELSDKGFYG